MPPAPQLVHLGTFRFGLGGAKGHPDTILATHQDALTRGHPGQELGQAFLQLWCPHRHARAGSLAACPARRAAAREGPLRWSHHSPSMARRRSSMARWV